MLGPVLHGLSRKRPVGGLDLVAPRNHQGKLEGGRVQTQLPQRQGPLIVGVGGCFQRIDAGPGQLELGLVIGEDPRGRIDGRLHGMLPQNPEAEGVDGADDGLIDLRPVMAQLLPRQHLPAHALAHLGGGGVGEGDGRHLGDAVIREQGDVAIDEDTGLAAAGAGGDQDVAAPLGQDRGLLRCHSQFFHRLNSFTRQMLRKEHQVGQGTWGLTRKSPESTASRISRATSTTSSSSRASLGREESRSHSVAWGSSQA